MSGSVEQQVLQFRHHFARVKQEIQKVIVGNEPVIDGVLTCLITGGHALLEGVPGLGKTRLVRTLAQATHLRFARIQFTPDLMPLDITGTYLLIESDGRREFRFQPGPIFANVVLADEINRATPKTQSALLEAMQEQSVTVTGKSHPLEEPFCVLATQNPVEMEGTYPLPEAQQDRFLFKLLVPSPAPEELAAILDRTTGATEIPVTPVIDAPTLLQMRALAREVPMAPVVRDFAIRVTLGTHPDSPYAPPEVRQFVRIGASPRGAQAMVLAAKVRALLSERYHVAVDDIVASAAPALRHRILRNFEGEVDAIAPDRLIEAVLNKALAEIAPDLQSV